ncbi:MAG: hypothetical protein LQ351_005965 [Letrouitia transgressa]|nr:MAG: hypothetical protein LQ351_005965 [Letrouitia transgressa]
MTDTISNETSSLTSDPNGSVQASAKSLAESRGVEAAKDIICGSIAGGLGKVIEYPFDTVKVRLQSQPDHLPLRYSGPLDCFRQSIQAEGFAGLYRGISAPLFGAAVETSSLFFSYRIAQDFLQNAFTIDPQVDGSALPLGALVTCGGASGAFTSLLLTPIELVKCQMQYPVKPSETRRPGPLLIISSILRNHGIFGFWHGQLGTLIRETGGSAAWFGSYEGISSLFRKNSINHSTKETVLAKTEKAPVLPVWQQMVAGASAGVAYNFIFFPADTVKSRMQTEELGSVGGNFLKRRTFWASATALWRQQGIGGLYRGCGVTVARSAPSSAVIFAMYEGLRELLG